jgi:hypothetical protein
MSFPLYLYRTVKVLLAELQKERENVLTLCEISNSHGGEYEVQICLLGCTAV